MKFFISTVKGRPIWHREKVCTESLQVSQIPCTTEEFIEKV